jgi:DNA primase
VKEFQIFDYLEERLDRFRRSSGNEITGQCPRCGRYGGFYANVVSGKFTCFKCDWKGRSIIGLVAELESCDWAQAQIYVFRHAVEFRRREDMTSLAERIAALRPHAVKEEPEPPVNFELPRDGFRSCYDARRKSWKLPRYLKERCIKSATARQWGLGFCRQLYLEFPNREKPFFIRDRLFIPIVCPAGRSWTARDMTGTQEPKYLNPPGADHRRLLIGWNHARLTGDLVIVEGPLDVIKLWQYELAALGLGGKELHDEQLAQLMTLSSETVVTVMLDPEELKARLAVAKRLSVHFKNVYLAELPLGIDPGAATRSQAYKAVEAATRWTGDRGLSLVAALKSSRAALKSRQELSLKNCIVQC